jgi:hypothetical protein
MSFMCIYNINMGLTCVHFFRGTKYGLKYCGRKFLIKCGILQQQTSPAFYFNIIILSVTSKVSLLVPLVRFIYLKCVLTSCFPHSRQSRWSKPLQINGISNDQWSFPQWTNTSPDFKRDITWGYWNIKVKWKITLMFSVNLRSPSVKFLRQIRNIQAQFLQDQMGIFYLS